MQQCILHRPPPFPVFDVRRAACASPCILTLVSLALPGRCLVATTRFLSSGHARRARAALNPCGGVKLQATAATSIAQYVAVLRASAGTAAATASSPYVSLGHRSSVKLTPSRSRMRAQLEQHAAAGAASLHITLTRHLGRSAFGALPRRNVSRKEGWKCVWRAALQICVLPQHKHTHSTHTHYRTE